VSIPNHSSLNITTNLTIESWIFIDTAGNYKSIIDKYKESPSRTGYSVYIKNTRNIVFRLALSSNTSYYLQSNTAVARNAWHHIACVFNGSSAKIYINGKLDKEESFASTSIITNAENLLIGFLNDYSPTYNTYWNGKLDEIRIWNVALSSGEIYSRMYQISKSTDSKYSNLVAYYMFDEGSGTVALDSSSKNNVGSLNNNPVYRTDVPPVSYQDHALFFDGTNDFLDCGTDNSLSFKKNFTIESWVRFSSFGTYDGLISKRDTVGGNAGYSLSVKNNTTKKLAFRLARTTNRNYELLSTTVFDTGIWYHVAASFDGNNVRIYVNGILDNQATGLNDSIYSTSSNLNIGKEFDRANEFNGQISEARVWSRALTQTEIQSRMFNKISETDIYWDNLHAYWRLDEAFGTKSYDFSKNENTATLKNGPVWKTVSSYFSDLTWLGITNDWNDKNNWSPARIPSYLTNILIPSTSYDPLMIGTGFTRNVTILADAALVINFGSNLTVGGDFRIKSSNTYTGSVYPNGTLTILGRSFLERTIIKNGWHYVSSPINNASSNVFLGAGLWYYNEQTATWVKVFSNQTLVNMRGYDVYYKNNDVTVIFEGTFNTGAFTTNVTAVYDSHNYIGNPYPSTIDWDATNGWTKTNVHNAIYIWDAASNNYMSYVNGVGTNGGSRYIPATQAFFVLCNSYSGGSVSVNNNARKNTHFPFREAINDDYLKLKLTDGTYNDETVIRLIDEASFKFDKDYDAYKFLSLNESVSNIYTKGNDQSQLSINSINSFGNGLVMPLYMKVGATGKFTISADMASIQTQYDILLEDKLTGKMHDFKTGNYTFNAEVMADPDRFLIHFVPVSAVFNTIDENSDSEYAVVVNDKNITVSPNSEISITGLALYNTIGQLIEKTKGNNLHSIDISSLTGGYYILQINTETNSFSTKVLVE